MPHHLLPKLLEDNRVPTISNVGVWHSFPTEVLERIGDGLDAAIDPDHFDVDSIPDVWARPLLFEMALYDKKHPLHKKIVGEWRGLIALVALSEWQHRYQVDVKRVSLADSDAAFSQIANKLTPKRTVASDTSWLRLHVLFLNGSPFAVTSPTTLLATAVSYQARGVEWFNGSVLCDPLRFELRSGVTEDVLSKTQKNAVANWLKEVESNLDNHPGIIRNEIYNSLLGVVHDYLDDLGGRQESLKLKENAWGMTTSDIFRYVDNLPRPPRGGGSDVVLQRTRDEASSSPNLLVLSPKIAEQWEVKAREVQVWGRHTLKDVRHLSEGRTSIHGQALKSAEWRREEDFFTDQLFVLRDTAGSFQPESLWQPRGVGEIEGKPLLPLNEELLAYLRPQDIADSVEISSRGNGRYVVRMKLPLSGSDGSAGEIVEIEKVYPSDRVTYLNELPIIEAWPDFSSDSWDEYYSYFDGGESFSIEPRPPASQQRIEETRRGAIVRANYKHSGYPEALVCFHSESKEPAGLLLLREPTEVESSGQVWKAGIDFGTTNTTVYANRGDGPERVEFRNRLQSITNPTGSQLTDVNNWFLPPCEQETPFPTLYQLFQKQAVGRGGAPRSLIDGHIFYINDVSYGTHIDVKEAPQLYHDLKWSDDPVDRTLIKVFLEQLYTQVMAEAAAEGVSKVEWSYSVPTSFSSSQRSLIAQIWRDLTSGKNAQERTESLCTAAYFLDRKNASMAGGAVCIDIGGASADVAIWQGLQMRLQTSVLLAGREIFMKTILASPDKFATMFGKEEIPKDLSALEILLKREGDSIMKDHYRFSQTAAARLIRYRVALGVSILLYYVGLLLQHLIDEGKFNSEENLPNLYFGGNGSKMIHWLGHGEFNPGHNPFEELFEKVLAQSSGLSASRLKIEVTPLDEMKHEVAYGLVSDRYISPDEADTVVLAGESFSTENYSQDWRAKLEADDYRSSIQIDPELSELRKVVSIVNEFASSSDVNIDSISPDRLEEYFRQARETVKAHLISVANKKEENIDVEPLFIIAARKFLTVLRDDQAKL